MNKNTILGLVILLIVVLGGYYYFNGKQQNNYSSQTPAGIQEEGQMQEEMIVNDDKMGTTEEGMMQEEAKKITVEGSEFKYNPSAISIKEGEKVVLTFKNVGNVPHNFVSEELGVESKTLNPGEEETLNFTASKTGTFSFYCSIGNHRAQGMEGEVDVK